MGAVIVMQPGRGDRRALFDIAVTGPLAGLIPALLFSIIGLQRSQVVQMAEQPVGLILGEPLLFRLLAYFTFGLCRRVRISPYTRSRMPVGLGFSLPH